MSTLVYINPLKPGKLEDYQAFTAINTGPRKAEYADMLKRYGLKGAKAFYHKFGPQEFIVVTHETEEEQVSANRAAEILAEFAASTHPYDQWFVEQLNDLHDWEQAGIAQPLLDFTV